MAAIDELLGERAGGSLRTKTGKSSLVLFASSVAQTILSLLSAAVLSRLLRPADFGMIASVTIVTAFLDQVKDLGLGLAIIQKQELTEEEVSNLFWVNVLASVGAALLVVAAARPVALFYHDMRLQAVTECLAFGVFASGLSIVHYSLLRRQMRFMQTEIALVAGLAISFTASCIAAKVGAGYWALVVGPLTATLVSNVFLLIFCPWLPHGPGKRLDMTLFTKFGQYVTYFNLLNFISRNLDNALIDRSWGHAALGQYSRAYQLMTMPFSRLSAPLTSALTPPLCQVANDGPRFKQALQDCLKVVYMVLIPFVGLVFALSDHLVPLILGPGWSEAVRCYKWLAVACMFQSLSMVNGSVYIAVAQTKRQFQVTIVSTIAVVSAFLIGLPYGAEGVSRSYALMCIPLSQLSIWVVTRISPLRFRDYYGAAVTPILIVVFLVGCAQLQGQVVGKSAIAMIVLSLLEYAGAIAVVLKYSHAGKGMVAMGKSLLVKSA